MNDFALNFNWNSESFVLPDNIFCDKNSYLEYFCKIPFQMRLSLKKFSLMEPSRERTKGKNAYRHNWYNWSVKIRLYIQHDTGWSMLSRYSHTPVLHLSLDTRNQNYKRQLSSLGMVLVLSYKIHEKNIITKHWFFSFFRKTSSYYSRSHAQKLSYRVTASNN